MARTPGRLLTRDQLLDAVTKPGSDKNDRNVDFLINRLRRKLLDDARNPRFIVTRYGEGYVWIGHSDVENHDVANAYLIIGPLLGLENLKDRADLALAFASELRAAAKTNLSHDREVELVPDLPPAFLSSGGFPRLAFALSFFAEGDNVHCVVTSKSAGTGQVLAAQRLVLTSARELAVREKARAAARGLLDESWRVMASGVGLGLPLPVAMYLAASASDADESSPDLSESEWLKQRFLHEARNERVWEENATRLRSLRLSNPDDPVLKLMSATQLHSRYISYGYQIFGRGEDNRKADEDEIERLVLEALPDIQLQPEYAIAAAKLLHFVDRGYFELARDIAEEAYGSSVSIASSLAIVGQLRAFAGETAAALQCIDQALNLIERGSVAHSYTLVIKCQALMAVRDFSRLQDAKQQLYANVPYGRIVFEPIFANPDKISLRAKAATMLLSRSRAAAILMYFHYISARLFRDRTQGANTLQTPVKLFTRRFGQKVVADEIVATYPGLLPIS